MCGAKFGVLWLTEGDGFRTGAMHNRRRPLARCERREPLYRPPPNSAAAAWWRASGRSMWPTSLPRTTFCTSRPGIPPRPVDLGGARTVLVVPMLKDDELVGAINIYRQEVRPFTDKQVEW